MIDDNEDPSRNKTEYSDGRSAAPSPTNGRRIGRRSLTQQGNSLVKAQVRLRSDLLEPTGQVAPSGGMQLNRTSDLSDKTDCP
ncbi:hypothetical protein [Micromonospora vulcania]|uniref:Uncharacterized protein n=1 Tax=Micromonospora vulcania TaxID=1441873 RepID=A0ABW1H5U1_9ACTN